MRIAVLGTGMVGQAIAGRLDQLDHTVTLGTRDPAATLARREPDQMGNPGPGVWASAHPSVAVATFADAAAGAEIVVNASNGAASLAVLELAGGEHLRGKVLVDVANPLDFSQGMPPTLLVKDDDSLGEQIQRAHPEALVVKTLNTMNAHLMVEPRQLADGDHSVFVAGNDAEAKAVVSALLTAMGHTDIIDLGDLSAARGTEMWLPLWLRLMGALGTAAFNIKVVR
jgi:8-hydroxy-5-deazaflavin:NADPH oxidoreductase